MSVWPFGRSRRRVFVLGIDGAPWSLLGQLMRRGVMPNLASLTRGRLVRMNSCIPTVSNVAWSCFQTGKNPGGFGVFGFAELTPEMDIRIPNSQDLRARTIWEMASEAGRRVIALGVPLTYPPRPVEGIMVGGFLAPQLRGAVHPPEMLAQFEKWGYRLDVDPMKARESLQHLKGDLLRCLSGRERAVMELLGGERWDLFVTHVMETDRINHFMWRFLGQPQSEDGKFFLDFYRRVDEFIGRILHALSVRTEFVLLSDHGFCQTRSDVQLNRWLEEQGYLSCAGPAEDGFKALSERSRAVALVPGRIHILRRGRWERGCVGGEEYEPLREELIGRLKDWKHPQSGAPVCEGVFRREELFSGPFVEMAPDIVVHPHDGFDLKAALGRQEMFTLGPINGMHTRYDAALFVRGRRIEAERPHIWDVTPTLLKLLDLPVPEDMDGRALV